MPSQWRTPIYTFRPFLGREIVIDVTTSVSPGLAPSSVVTDILVDLMRRQNVRTVLDFGAGALRHTLPLLEAGFEVCAVEFEEAFARPTCGKARQQAERHPNFSKLIWPKQFIGDRRRFDAALLIYVLQVMPVPREREEVLRQLYRKLWDDTYLFYASRYGQITRSDRGHRVSDGYFRWPARKHHSFYREFTTEETHAMIGHYGFKRIRSLGGGGSEQMFLYAKGRATWI